MNGTATVTINLTAEDLDNIGLWLKTTTMMVQSKLRTPLTPSEKETWVKIERAKRLLRMRGQ